jgi:hypothetical protein
MLRDGRKYSANYSPTAASELARLLEMVQKEKSGSKKNRAAVGVFLVEKEARKSKGEKDKERLLTHQSEAELQGRRGQRRGLSQDTLT